MIDWAESVRTGAAMPVDHNSAGVLGGTLAVWRDGDRLLCRAMKKGDELQPGERLGTAHWGTCPSAMNHRRGRNTE